MIITIDGPAGSGKSTVAEILSQKLGFVHFNSGSLYRGITYYLIKTKFNFDKDSFPKLNLKTKYENNIQRVYVNDVDCTNFLRDNEVSILTPAVSQNPKVRKLVDNCQRKFGKKNSIVIDGRDIGSYVFPDADFKFYLDCDLHIRAKRRQKEEKLKNNKISLKEIEKQLFERDEIDKNKKIAPLVIPKNAHIMDTSNLSIDQVVDLIITKLKFDKKI